MILLELALQGIRGFPPLARLMLRPGMNVAHVSDALQRRAILDAIYHVLFPDPARATATQKLAEPSAKDARFALTFFGRDKITYRLVREATNGAVSLHRFDPEQNKYTAMTRTAMEASQYLRVQQQLPDEVGYERLFVFSPEAMPSHGLKAKTRSGSSIASGLGPSGAGLASSGPGLPAKMGGGQPIGRAPSGVHSIQQVGRGGSGFGSAMNMNNALVQAEIRRTSDLPRAPSSPSPPAEPAEAPEPQPDVGLQIAELKEALARARTERQQVSRAEAAQVELDALNQRRFELTTKVERVKLLRSEVEKLSEQSRLSSDLKNLPKGFSERLRHMEEAQTKYLSDRQKLVDEQIELDRKISQDFVAPLKGDRYFLAGVALAALFVALAVVYGKPALALLNIPCLVVAAGAAFRWVGDLERHARLEVKQQTAREREQRLDRQFEQDTAQVRRLMQTLDIQDPRELLERVEGAQKVERQREVAEDALKRQLEDPQIADADRELMQVSRRIEALEAETMSVQSVLSAETLDRRVIQMENELVELEAREKARMSGVMPGRAASAPAPAPRATSSLAPKPRVPSVVPRAPTKEAEKLFDFGGGNIGADDEEDGYGGGYGSSGGGGGGGAGGKPGSGAASYSGGSDALSSAPSIGGGGGGGRGGSGLHGAYSDDGGAGSILSPDRSRDLFNTAVDLLQIPVDDLAQRIQKRVGQYLGAFTDEAYDAAEFGARGEMAVIPKGGGQPVGFMDLGVQEINLVDAALRFALVEACVAKFKIPLLFDDPFLDFPIPKRKLLSQMLGYLAKMTQVFLLTERQDVTGNEVKW